MLGTYSRLSAIAAIVAAGVVLAACSSTASSSTAATNGPSPGTSATTKYAPAQATIIGKNTDVVVNHAVSAALKHASITVTAVAPATAKRTLLFPVSGGQIVVATLAGTIDHAGGLTFSHGTKNVTLTTFVINTNTKQLTATVGGQPMPIFDLNLASLKRASSTQGIVIADNLKLTVTAQAVTALNSGLGVSTFKAGMNFGIATLTVAYAHGHR